MNSSNNSIKDVLNVNPGTIILGILFMTPASHIVDVPRSKKKKKKKKARTWA